MRGPRLTDQEARLLQPPAPGRFGAADLVGLPKPVRRYLTQAITPGTPLATAGRLRMRGRIKVGRWLPFRAHQVLNPHPRPCLDRSGGRGHCWLRPYVDGTGGMDWKLAGLLTVARAQGPHVTRSTVRAGAEAIWLPTTLLPASGCAGRQGPSTR